jgi:hypothetical protein
VYSKPPAIDLNTGASQQHADAIGKIIVRFALTLTTIAGGYGNNIKNK